MIKKTITYTDYNGLERTEDFWFNITEAEALEMEMSTTGGYGDMIRRVVAAQDMPTIIKVFKAFIFKALARRVLMVNGSSSLRSFPPHSPRPRHTLSCIWNLPPMRTRPPSL